MCDATDEKRVSAVTARASQPHHLHYNLENAPSLARPLALAQLWHWLSLDAPTVALVWCWFFARCARVELPWYSPPLLALATWIVYVADRLLDGFRENSSSDFRQRHHFYARHRTVFVLALVLAILVCLGIVFTSMRRDVLIANCILGALVSIYFLMIHGFGRKVERWFPKELVVGTLFAAATALPTWVRLPQARLEFGGDVALLAALCWLNCVAIEEWESSDNGATTLDRLHRSHFSTRAAGNHLTWTAGAIAVVAGICALLCIHTTTGTIALACVAGSIFLAALDQSRQRISAIWLRIAADASLLTPLLFLPFMART